MHWEWKTMHPILTMQSSTLVYQSPSLHQTGPWGASCRGGGTRDCSSSRSSTSRSCTLSPTSILLSQWFLSQSSPWAGLRWMRNNRRPHASLHIFKARCGQSAAWRPNDPTPPPEYQAKASLSAENLPKGLLSLYPSIRSEFQIRIKVCVRTSSIRYLLKRISSRSLSPPKDFSSRVLLLLSSGDEWHIRDSLQLIPSFMLSESKLQARGPLPLYLSSFEIRLNVMLDLRRKRGAFLNFVQRRASRKTDETSKHQSETRALSSQAVGYSWSRSRKQLMNVLAGNLPLKLPLFFGGCYCLFFFF